MAEEDSTIKGYEWLGRMIIVFVGGLLLYFAMKYVVAKALK